MQSEIANLLKNTTQYHCPLNTKTFNLNMINYVFNYIEGKFNIVIDTLILNNNQLNHIRKTMGRMTFNENIEKEIYISNQLTNNQIINENEKEIHGKLFTANIYTSNQLMNNQIIIGNIPKNIFALYNMSSKSYLYSNQLHIPELKMPKINNILDRIELECGTN